MVAGICAGQLRPARGFSLRHRLGSGLMASTGFVYVFRNPGLTAYKVGMTTRALRLRADELQREYGTVYPFEIASRHAVDDPAAVEALAHRILARYRVPRSELFACDLAACHRAVKAAAVLVLDRPWWLRCWHWVTLPRPAVGLLAMVIFCSFELLPDLGAKFLDLLGCRSFRVSFNNA